MGTNLPALPADAAVNILKASDGHAPLLKFKKGKFFASDNELPLGGEYIAYCADWMHGWVKFVDGEKVGDRIGRVADGFKPPERHELDDNDQKKWPAGVDGKPNDPWVFQHFLPLENVESGDRYVFISSSAGGKIAVRRLCNRYAKNIERGLPTVRLDTAEFPSKQFGKIPRPDFPIVAWENDGHTIVRPPSGEAMNDKIPF